MQQHDLQMLVDALQGRGPSRIKLNTRSGYVLIDPEDIVYCQADGSYTHLHLSRGHSEIITQNLGAIEVILVGNAFFRSSRSYILNLNYLTRVDRKNCVCHMEYPGATCNIKIPSQKIKILESTFSR